VSWWNEAAPCCCFKCHVDYDLSPFSFAPIVLVLKVLMVQQGLDKPFTGGLGSYKLYVLVAHHVSYFNFPKMLDVSIQISPISKCLIFLFNQYQIECHLANGGMDRPSEILIR
jgi:hypothetical protein